MNLQKSIFLRENLWYKMRRKKKKQKTLKKIILYEFLSVKAVILRASVHLAPFTTTQCLCATGAAIHTYIGINSSKHTEKCALTRAHVYKIQETKKHIIHKSLWMCFLFCILIYALALSEAFFLSLSLVLFFCLSAVQFKCKTWMASYTIYKDHKKLLWHS